MEEFKGDLKKIAPRRLIKEDRKDAIEIFFLTLSLVYNDLKGLFLFKKSVEQIYRVPSFKESNVHAGEWGGVSTQIHRLLLSFLSEFFSFLEKHRSVVNSTEFAQILVNLNSTERETWNNLTDVAFHSGNIDNVTRFKDILLKVRGNVTYHYSDAGKNLRLGFIERFFKKDIHEQNKHAYYSIGQTMESSRFYFADAAVQEYVFKQIRGDESVEKKVEKDIENFNDHEKEIMDIAMAINLVIIKLLKNYIGNRPH